MVQLNGTISPAIPMLAIDIEALRGRIPQLEL